VTGGTGGTMTSRRAQIGRMRRVALAALDCYALPDGRLTFVTHGENTTFRHDSVAGRYLVRVHRPQRHGRDVDSSAAMLQAAKKRLQGFENVDLRRGELEALPVDDAKLDAATLMLVLHHVPEPQRALAEVARVLKPRGQAVVVDMLPHDRESYRQQMGHVWLGFSDDHVRRMFQEAGFEQIRLVALPPDARAKGPGLFVATGQRT